MNRSTLFPAIFIALTVISFSQTRDYKIHSRGMLHQTVYNTGELGRVFDGGANGIPGGYPPSMEWPPYSHTTIDRAEYAGQHNSLGGGLHLSATRQGKRVFAYCGGISTSNAQPVEVAGVYSTPISVERIENYPILADGSINPSYNADEAEEIIISKWLATGVDTVSVGIEVTRISRAWSYPGYNNFIIYEYVLKNTTTDTLKDAFFSWAYGLAPSAFGYTRAFGHWLEKDFRLRAFARLDTKRYLTYVHDWDGKLESFSSVFDTWSKPGDRGGLNSPQAVGIMMLHYDYNHLTTKMATNVVVTAAQDTVVWDSHLKMKQPYLLRYENANLSDSKVGPWLDIQARKTGPASFTDGQSYGDYWVGRVKPNYKNGYAQPVVHGYGFGPYTLAPGETANFTVAEVVGYGAGVAGDSIYNDIGGSSNTAETGPGLHPIPSWYKKLSYDNLLNGATIGSDYLQTHPLPWYVDAQAISIRDNADMAIQLYTGTPFLKHDGLANDMSTQFEPLDAPEHGNYTSSIVKIPFPSPVITVKKNEDDLQNNIIWNNKLEAFAHPKLRAPLNYYRVLHAPDPLGPWTVLAEVAKSDARYFHDTAYVVVDTNYYDVFATRYYAVISVDVNGDVSGMNNMTSSSGVPLAVSGSVVTAKRFELKQNYPNPFNPSTKISYTIEKPGLTNLIVYNLLGQKVCTLVNEIKAGGTYSTSFNAIGLPSGIYIYRLQNNGMVQTRKMLLIK